MGPCEIICALQILEVDGLEFWRSKVRSSSLEIHGPRMVFPGNKGFVSLVCSNDLFSLVSISVNLFLLFRLLVGVIRSPGLSCTFSCFYQLH